MKNWVNLHTHSREGSLLDGQGSVENYFQRAAELGQPGLAVTEHGNLFSLLDAMDAAQASGVKFIPGEEFYCARKTRWDRDEDERSGKARDEFHQRGPYHLTVLARNNTGYKNLIQLSSKAFLEGYLVKGRIDHELLQQHGEGLTVLSGCLSGEVQQALLLQNYDKALQTATTMQDLVGKDNFYIEIQNHGIDEQTFVNPQLLRLAKQIGAKVVATGDTHYVRKEDAYFHDLSLCLSVGSRVADENRFRFTGHEFYLKSYDEMSQSFEEEWLDNTLLVAEQVEDKIVELGEYHFPQYPIPEGYTTESYFEELVWDGLRNRYGELTEEVVERAKHEIHVINKMGFPNYFLVVSDICRWTKGQKIRMGPGRGCLLGDVPVAILNRGFVPIKEVEIGDKVISHTGSLQDVVNVFQYSIEEEIYTIRSYFDDSSHPVRLTADHKVLVEKGQETDGFKKCALRGKKFNGPRWKIPSGSPSWIEARAIEPGDWVMVPLQSQEEKIPSTIDLANYIRHDDPRRTIEVYDDHLLEISPINMHYNFSLRDVSRRYGLSRSMLVRIANQIRTSEGSFIQRLNQKTVQVIEQILKDGSFADLNEWIKYVDTNSYRMIVIPRFIEVNQSFMQLLGMIVSNGWLRQNQPTIGLAVRGSEDDSLCPKTFEKVWGLNPSLKKHATKDVNQYTFTSRVIYNLYSQILSEYHFTSQTKHLPNWALTLSAKLKWALVDGLWWGDGSHKDGKSSYSTTSKRLCDQLRQLLWSLHISNGVLEDEREDKRFEFKNRALAYKITVPYLFKDRCHSIKLDQFLYMRVFSVEAEIKNCIVYDLQIKEDNSFLTSSFVVHNSVAGSVCAYALDITNVDPLRFGLMFERFLVAPEAVWDPVFTKLKENKMPDYYKNI